MFQRRLLLLLLCLFSIAAVCLMQRPVSASIGDNKPCKPTQQVCYASGSTGLTPFQQQGRDTWYFWTGGDTDTDGNVVGDQALWRFLAVRTHGTVDLLQAIDSRYRNERFQRFGVMNDPDCLPATAPDPYGLWIDTCTQQNVTGPVGDSAGVIGLRRFANPKFNAKAWTIEKYGNYVL